MLRFTLALLGLGLAPTVTATPNYSGRAFITSTTGTAQLGSWAELGVGGFNGVPAGDRICQIRAQAAGRPGAENYRAWLSTPITDAYCHIIDRTGKKENNCGLPVLPAVVGPWLSVDGRLIISNLNTALNPQGAVYHAFDRDERGERLTTSHPSQVWTGTNVFGEYESSYTSCLDWTASPSNAIAAVGHARHTTTIWTAGGWAPCSNTHHLLCMTAHGGNDVVNPVEGSGPQAFITSVTGNGNLNSWADAGGRVGVEAGDQICRVRATAAHLLLPQSFKAFLSAGPSVAAISRFVHDGPRYRVDGVRFANNLADLADGEPATALNVDENGAYQSLAHYARTGSDRFGQPHADHCNGWTNGTSAFQGMLGDPSNAATTWSGFTQTTCANQSYGIYCVSDATEDMVVRIFRDGMENPVAP
jgi:hypothetical protein